MKLFTAKSLFIPLLFTIAFANKINVATAQDETAELPQSVAQVVPPSPNAAALGKYGDIPVSYYSGLPTITVPLYEIKTRDLSIPLTLSYHASGIRVDEEASWVGLGWVLNGGGAITRTVVNHDDFDPAFNYFGEELPPFLEGSVPVDYYQLGCQARFQKFDTNSKTYQTQEVDFSKYVRVGVDNYELEPDQYSFNFLGQSGKFILDRDYQAILANQEKIEFTPSEDGRTWRVRGADGTVYEFEEYESYTDYRISRPVYTAWYLTKVISTTGKTVTFHYNKDNSFTRPIGSVYEEHYFNGITGVVTGQGGSPRNTCTRGPLFNITEQKAYTNVTLSYIDHDNGRVVFDYDNNRVDLEGGKRLTSVQIYKKDISGEVATAPFKQYDLTYDYFLGLGDDDITKTNGTSDRLAKRLKLVSVQEKSPSSDKGAHVFRYNEKGGVNNLPCKASFARDHWGYYNGARDNQTLIPAFEGEVIHVTEDVEVIQLAGANREPSPLHVQAFSLKSIQYPTGGISSFEYDSHDFDVANSVVNDKSWVPLRASTKEAFTTLTYDKEQGDRICTKVLDLRQGYTPDGTTLRVELSTAFVFSNTYQAFADAGGAANADKMYFELYYPNGVRVGRVDLSLADCEDDSKACTYKSTYTLVPGKYIWKASIDPKLEEVEFITATYSWRDELRPSQSEDDLPITGGLRINTIINRDGSGLSPNEVRKFVYHYQADKDSNGTDEVYSHGRRMARPIYYRYNTLSDEVSLSPAPASITYRCWWFIRSASSSVPLNGTAGGSVVGYDEVSVLYGRNGEYGKSIFRYENHPDVVNNYQLGRMPGLPNLVSNRNGLLLKQTDYEFKNEGYRKVRSVVNTYAEATEPEKEAQTIYAIHREFVEGKHTLAGCGVRLYMYPALRSEWIRLTSTKETLYNLGVTAPSARTTTSHTYEDIPQHYQRTSTTLIDSENQQRTTEYKYAADLNESLLLDNHMHSQVLTQTTKVADATTRKSVMVYQQQDGRILPFTFKNYPTGNQEEVKTDYQYDDRGNVVQIQKEYDLPVTYIWGYGQTLPVAKVVGETYDNVVSTINLAALQNYNGDQLRTELSKIKDAYSQARVSIYTYDPLLGITSATDPNGLTTYYEYDSLGRLSHVKDHEQQRLQSYQYQYHQKLPE